MKKLMIMVLLAAFAVGCTATSIEEDDYENNIELVDKNKNVRPGNQGGGD